MALEVSDDVADAAKEVLTTAFAESAKPLVEEWVRDQIPNISAALLEATQAVVKGVGGLGVALVLRLIIRAADKSEKQFDRLLSEPLRTAYRELGVALGVVPQSRADRLIVQDRLRFADQKLAVALTYAESADDWRQTAFICFIRGVVLQAQAAKAV